MPQWAMTTMIVLCAPAFCFLVMAMCACVSIRDLWFSFFVCVGFFFCIYILYLVNGKDRLWVCLSRASKFFLPFFFNLFLPYSPIVIKSDCNTC